MKKRLDRRGSVLLLVVVLLAVISLLAAAAVSFSHSELGAARNERSGDELLACADAGRQYMVSRFDMLNISNVAVDPVNVDLNAAGIVDCPNTPDVPKNARCVRNGHLGQFMSVDGVTAVASNAGGDKRAMRDVANTIGGGMLGGKPHKITVHCLDENGRGTEVEFVVKFGI